MPASSVRISLPTLRRREQPPLEVEIHQAEYAHDLVVYKLPNRAGTTAYRAGTPVHVEWSRGRHTSTFHGVIDHLEPAREAGDPTIEVWCSGASVRFNDGLQAQYLNRTVPSVLSAIARSRNFDVQVTAHGRVFDAITFPGGRIWDTMVDYAQQIGYSLYCTNTRFEMHPRTALVSKFAQQAPVFFRQTDGSLGGGLYSFSPQYGAEEPGQDRVNRVITGIDYRTGVPFSARAGVPKGLLGRETVVPHNTHYQNVGVSTPEEARWKLKAMTEGRRFNHVASAVTEGDPRVRQMWPVLLGNVETPYTGLWCATKVVHKFNRLDYWLELELGRDATVSNVSLPDPRARRVIVDRNNPQGRPKSVYPPSVLVGGQWRSQWSSATRTFKGG